MGKVQSNKIKMIHSRRRGVKASPTWDTVLTQKTITTYE